MSLWCRCICGLLLLASLPAFAREYRFDGSISESVLRSYLVELNNWGVSSKPGQAGTGGGWVWGYDEITWFAQQPEAYRNEWLRYPWRWVREHDREGYLEMPGSRCLAVATKGKQWYGANRASAATPDGFGQEETIRASQRPWTPASDQQAGEVDDQNGGGK